MSSRVGRWLVLLALSASACAGDAATPPDPDQAGAAQAPAAAQAIPMFGYVVVNVFPHDRSAFTQGLVYYDGFLYESTGQVGQSSIRQVEIATGKVIRRVDVEPPHFAEGLALAGDAFVQLTWQGGVAFVYDRQRLARVRTFNYTGEGWGLAHDGRRFILSDGSPTLRFLDTGTFEETGRVTVSAAGTPLEEINELEVVRDEIFANVWHTNRIARIDPATGTVRGWIDLTGLLRPGEVTDSEAVLNGIAWDARADRLFVTGKLWPKVFEIRLEDR